VRYSFILFILFLFQDIPQVKGMVPDPADTDNASCITTEQSIPVKNLFLIYLESKPFADTEKKRKIIFQWTFRDKADPLNHKNLLLQTFFILLPKPAECQFSGNLVILNREMRI